MAVSPGIIDGGCWGTLRLLPVVLCCKLLHECGADSLASPMDMLDKSR